MQSLNFVCPYCNTFLKYTGLLPTRINCPVCQSQINLDSEGSPFLTRAGPPAPRRGVRTLGGATIGAVLGGTMAGPGGAVVGGIIGGIIGGSSEPST